MSEPLADTEALCKEIINSLSDVPESAQLMKRRVQTLLPKIVESRKKLMIKSPKGREISASVLKDATKLHQLVTDSKGKLGDDVSKQLGHLEGSVAKLEIYWKSFEYVTT